MVTYWTLFVLPRARLHKLNKRFSCLSAFCLLVLLCLLLALWSGHFNSIEDPDQQFAWLRRSRDARLYVRPLTKTTLLEPSEQCNSNHRLLLMVTSAPSHTENRQAIRDTWGQRHPDAKHFFFLGREESETEPSADILSESHQYGDLIVEDFVDTYQNLTLKTLFMLKWVLDNCAFVPYILKTDDDMLINTRGLIRQLDHLGDGSQSLVSGMRYRNVSPYRDSSSKWYVPEWLYSQDVFPDFVSGTAYLMSRVAAKKLYDAALDTPLMPLEDVFLTGIVASQGLGMPLENLPRFRKDRPSKVGHPCLFHHLLTVHELPPTELKRIWTSLIDLKPSSCDSLFVKFLAFLYGTGKFQVLLNDPW
ncbi:beta-1,3-galactosyltransferase 5 isoform X2 [Anabrus simplex]|uniref:beta-1,3-galactosyltransferase 5 isoform X2 n=1 Tax=Anabrus simplex TaxID=316456 RepID=UPI0035A2929C